MAASQIEDQQEQTLSQEYTHKKFNWGYSHKKLGLRFRQREQKNKENLPEIQNQELKNNKSTASKGLFRPYALDDNNTPKKRKISRSSESSEENYTKSPVNTPQASPSTYQLTYQQQLQIPLSALPSPAMSHESYVIRLQRLRAALYMRYMTQMQQQTFTALTPYASLQTANGYPNVTAPLY